MDVLRCVWMSDAPFDYDGEFYRFAGANSQVRPLQQPHPPLYFGGASGPALAVGAQYADVYALWGNHWRACVNASQRFGWPVHRSGRMPRNHVSFRPILGETQAAAWERAHTIPGAVSPRATPATDAISVGSEGSRRLLEYAARSELHDDRLWMPVAAATERGGNTTALVGTAEQVVDSLMRYYELGVRTFLVRGFDPLHDTHEYGRELLPLLRERVAAAELASA